MTIMISSWLLLEGFTGVYGGWWLFLNEFFFKEVLNAFPHRVVDVPEYVYAYRYDPRLPDRGDVLLSSKFGTTLLH